MATLAAIPHTYRVPLVVYAVMNATSLYDMLPQEYQGISECEDIHYTSRCRVYTTVVRAASVCRSLHRVRKASYVLWTVDCYGWYE